MSNILWGVRVQQNGSGDVIMSAEYFNWLASYVNETCNCGPHIDHEDCITEAEALVKFARDHARLYGLHPIE